jgi:hypothetical protein
MIPCPSPCLKSLVCHGQLTPPLKSPYLTLREPSACLTHKYRGSFIPINPPGSGLHVGPGILIDYTEHSSESEVPQSKQPMRSLTAHPVNTVSSASYLHATLLILLHNQSYILFNTHVSALFTLRFNEVIETRIIDQM